MRKTRQDGNKERDKPRQDDAGDTSDAGLGGGEPATEEDIGTEGAGTEPRSTPEVDRDRGSPSQDPRKGAPRR